MPGFDDRLRRELKNLAQPGSSDGAWDRIAKRRQRIPVVRRAQAAGLAVAVLAASAGGGYGLYRAFGLDKPSVRRPVVGPTERVRNGEIAFLNSRPESVGGEAIYAVNPDGSGLRTIYTRPFLYSAALSWSPDGSRLAFDVGISEGKGAIEEVRADGSQLKRLLGTGGQPSGPAWSPDGGRLAFAGGPFENTISILDLATSEARVVTDPTLCADTDPKWSPDGNRVAFVRSCAESSEIMIVAASGTDVQRITRGQQVAWSPDGGSLAIARQVSASDRSLQVFTYRLASGAARQLTSAGNNYQPAWSPDGTQIAFVSTRDGNPEIYVMQTDGSAQRNLTNDPAKDEAPAWQPIPIESAPLAQPNVPPELAIGPACQVSTTNGDYDGDHRDDTAVVYSPVVPGAGPAGYPCAGDLAPFRIAVFLHSGDRIDAVVDGCQPIAGYCHALASPDLDLDGKAEVLITVDHGASTSFFHVFVLMENGLEAATIVHQSGPAEFPIFGTVGDNFGFGCRSVGGSRQVVVVSAGAQRSVPAPGRYDVTEQRYRLHGATFGKDGTKDYQLAGGDPRWGSLFNEHSICGAPISAAPTDLGQPSPPRLPACRFGDLSLSGGDQGATQSQILALGVQAPSPCSLDADLILTIVGPGGDALEIDGNGSTIEVSKRLEPRVSFIWGWGNWCGIQSGIDYRIELNPYDGQAPRVLIVHPTGTPVCNSPGDPSTVSYDGGGA